MQTQITDVLLNDMALLEEILEGTTTSSKSIDFFTDVGNISIERGRIVCYLDTHTVTITMDQTGDSLTFSIQGVLSKTQVTNGIAEVLATIAENIRTSSTELRDIAQTKYP